MDKVYYQRDPGGWDADRRFGALKAATPALLTGDVDLRAYCTPSDQLHLGACAGNATADSIEVVTAIAEEAQAAQEGREPRPVPQLSRLFVYGMARTLDGSLGTDGGTYLRSCFDAISRFGICEETDWPYDEAQVFVSPSLLAQRKARGRRIHGAYRIDSEGDARLDDIRAALRRKQPVVFGTMLATSFDSYRGGTLPRPVGPMDGGHAMMIVGCVGDRFLVKNSWGTSWGERGFAWFSPDYLTWKETWDLWVPPLGYTMAGQKGV
jgi:C1A family cysteine protease